MALNEALYSAEGLVKAPLVHKGKVRELYDLGEHYLMVVTDRISAFDYVLRPAVPGKGRMLNSLSEFWFGTTETAIANHMVHTDLSRIQDIIHEPEKLRGRFMVVKKATRIPVECVVRGYVTGGGWRQYEQTGMINGQKLPEGLRKNQVLEHPIFTPAKKNDQDHDEDITLDEMRSWLGDKLTDQLLSKSIMLYALAHTFCDMRGIILADTKLEFGFVGDQIILIDELFTPDSSRFWAEEKYGLDIEIDSMDKEPVRTYLQASGWDRNSEPGELPADVVADTAQRYENIARRLID